MIILNRCVHVCVCVSVFIFAHSSVPNCITSTCFVLFIFLFDTTCISVHSAWFCSMGSLTLWRKVSWNCIYHYTSRVSWIKYTHFSSNLMFLCTTVTFSLKTKGQYQMSKSKLLVEDFWLFRINTLLTNYSVILVKMIGSDQLHLLLKSMIMNDLKAVWCFSDFFSAHWHG